MITFILGVFVGAAVGWVAAHHQIAAECERLGGFFVKKKTYLIGEIVDTQESSSGLKAGNYGTFTVNPPPKQPRPKAPPAPPIAKSAESVVIINQPKKGFWG